MTPASLLKFRAVPPAWLLPAGLVAWAMDSWLPLYGWLAPPWNWALAVPSWLASLALTGRGARGLARHGTTIYPNGQASALVTDGPYRYSRNPMYLGMALLVLGFALALGSVGALLGVPVFMLAVQWLFILPEEQRLEGLFGEAYRSYCRRVRRWL